MTEFPCNVFWKMLIPYSRFSKQIFGGSSCFFRSPPFPNIATKSHDFPIHIVSRHGHIEMLRWLAQVPGFDANLRRSTMGGTADTPLHIAASKGHLELVMYLVEKCDSDVSPRLGPTKGGFSPLHCAIESGHTAVVKYLSINTARTRTHYNVH